MIFLSGSNSTRPYVKYASDNKGRIDLFYPDGHPRREAENNVYHAFYEDGAIHNSRGKKIRSLEAIKDKPLLPGDGTLIYDGSGPGGRGWVHDFEHGEDDFRKRLALVREFGHAVVVLCIDEKGMAKTKRDKIAIAERAMKIADELSYERENLVFDFL